MKKKKKEAKQLQNSQFNVIHNIKGKHDFSIHNWSIYNRHTVQ